MFTRCPKCKEVHPLTAEVLSRSTGLVQCGKCDRIFNALSFLSDDWHASQTFKPSEDSNSELPVLGGRWRARSRHAAAKTATDLQSETTDSKGSRHYSGNLSRTQTGDNSQAGSDTITNAAPEEPDTVQPRRWLWGLAATALILLTLMNAAWTFRDHLLQDRK